jgi:hypothetical protein
MKNYLILMTMLLATFLVSCNVQVEQKEEGKAEVAITETVQKPNTLSQEELDEGWILMFNGMTSDGWRSHNGESFPENGWEVVDGTLHVLGSGRGEAGGGGDILFDRKFENFELSLEWMVSEGGNSGIFYLGQEIPGDPVWKSAPEMQILDNERHPDAKLGVDGNRAAGALYDLIPGDFSAVKPAGEWNEAKVMVYRGTVIHTMNGQNVVEYHLWTDDWKNMVANSKFKDYEHFVNPASEGYIVLQDHGDDVWFRNIKIREL